MTCIVIANVACKKNTCPKDPFVCSKQGMNPYTILWPSGWDVSTINPERFFGMVDLDSWVGWTKQNQPSKWLANFFLPRRGRESSHRDLHINWKREKTWNNGRCGPTCQFFIGIPVASQNLDRIQQTDFVENSPEDTRPFFGAEKCRPQNSGPCRETIEGFFRGSRLVWF